MSQWGFELKMSRLEAEVERMRLALLGSELARAAMAEQISTMRGADYENLRTQLGKLAEQLKLAQHDKGRWLRKAIRETLRAGKLERRRICGTCDGKGIAVYVVGTKRTKSTVLNARALVALNMWDEMVKYEAPTHPLDIEICGDPWHTLNNGTILRSRICRHCLGMGWVEVAR